MHLAARQKQAAALWLVVQHMMTATHHFQLMTATMDGLLLIVWPGALKVR
jgi:hypothetical protein